jgi:geranylgeranyl pyrophosphate synthase
MSLKCRVEEKERFFQQKKYFVYLSETASLVDPCVRENILQSFPSQTDIRTLLQGRYRFGKAQLRPALVRMAYELVGGQNWQEIVLACASVELRDTAYYCYDEVADLKGNPKLFLLANAFITLSNQAIDGLRNQRVLSELFKLDENNISGGFVEFKNVNDEKYYLKKAVGFNFWESAFRIGAILAGVKDDSINTLGEIGKNIGMAYIIANDTWDFGKNLEDFSAGKFTLPIIWAKKNVKGNDKIILEELFGKEINEQEKNVIRRIMVAIGAIAYGKKVAQDYCQKAITLLDTFPSSETKKIIEFSLTMTQKNKYYSFLETF